ncbi:protein SHORT ROOT IN SALT MEDIUM 1 isoform X3 [Beta vulgaris subsp. vulgaris]|uniref:protein SHORT ROOT IN SALT MEDIUM 1 isoform X3 n=1 Tax=Beta vulgaris subsp. vulgaris TaxID=3555 RepID=UPI002036E693|nr:protein SHORT ROOT IN SALT MEDIUM 1 isoform X3 [Beta vulgaris subsp. vulgaris]
MYNSRGSNPYGQQSYTPQSSYGQNSTSTYPGNSAVGPASSSQLTVGSRHASLMGGSLEQEISGFRAHPAAAQYGGQYGSLYGQTSVSAGQQTEMYDRLEQASILRQDQMLKPQSLQSAPHEGSRQADYLAVRSGTYRHPTQELVSYGGRLEADPRIPVVGNSSYGGQPAPSILGAAPQRNVDDLVYAQTSANPGYGVSLPPGRDYGMGKGLHGTTLESDFPGNLSSRSGLSRVDDQKDDRYARELDIREEERRRERLRDRERERERDREREREKERERKRLLELRDKERERDRERKRALESRRERTPPRASKDRRGSSLAKDGKSSRRDSPRREALHRVHSPVKEKRREYVCKVYTSRLVDVERDYLSLDKRYPRLYISSDFSKVVVNWPRENLKLPMCTPVSFEHDFVEDESGTDQKELSAKHSDTIFANAEHRSTVWNAKMILMSGLSRSATEDLSSEKTSDDRIPHICNLLRFAVLKKDRTLMAIGGPWDAVDGGDPSLDDSSLVRTVLRYAKDMSHLDLQNCQNWNRFLEIHYDRVGKDGFFSHREVTVFFVPDLSDCLPSLNAWREQWLAHKKAVAEREKKLSVGKEKLREKKNPSKESTSPRDSKKSEKKEIVSTGHSADAHKEKDGEVQKASVTVKDGEKNTKNAEKKEMDELTDDTNNVEKKAAGANTSAQKTLKPAKKKIVRKIVKKVTDKVVGGEDGSNDNSKLEDKAAEAIDVNSETACQLDASPADVVGVKMFTRKKVAKKLSEADATVKEVDKESGLKSGKQTDSAEDIVEVKSDATGVTVVRDGPVKRVVKRKIIKRVPKKKVTAGLANSETSDSKTLVHNEDGKTNNAGKLSDIVGDAQVPEDKATEGGSLVKKSSTIKAEVESSEKHNDVVLSSKTEKTAGKVKGKEEERLDEKRVSETKNVPEKDNHADSKENIKGKAKVKDGKERKEKDKKDEPRSKSSKDVERKKSEEPPRHPGLILQTKSDRATKLRSLSLSLDSLLDYSDKDVEEETFELSVFAESLYEMLQFQMGCRVLTFLQKLRIKFVTKRNSRKRQREQNADSKRKEKTSAKRQKTKDSPTEENSSKTPAKDETRSGDDKLMAKLDGAAEMGTKSEKTDEVEKLSVEDDEDMVEEEDPEEDPEEDEEEEEEEDMQDASPREDSSKEIVELGKIDAEQSKKQGEEKDARKQTAEDSTNGGEKKASGDSEPSKPKEVRAEVSKKLSADVAPVDKELLQAFRFFDRNRVGYVRVEDLRMIVHNLGKFLSHRDVKELVQSALLESNTGRDDRILYEKLVRMSLDMDK